MVFYKLNKSFLLYTICICIYNYTHTFEWTIWMCYWQTRGFALDINGVSHPCIYIYTPCLHEDKKIWIDQSMSWGYLCSRRIGLGKQTKDLFIGYTGSLCPQTHISHMLSSNSPWKLQCCWIFTIFEVKTPLFVAPLMCWTLQLAVAVSQPDPWCIVQKRQKELEWEYWKHEACPALHPNISQHSLHGNAMQRVTCR